MEDGREAIFADKVHRQRRAGLLVIEGKGGRFGYTSCRKKLEADLGSSSSLIYQGK